MKKYEDFEGMVVSLLSPRKFWIQTWFCNCLQYLCLFHIVVECTPSIHDPRKMLVLPKSTSLLSRTSLLSSFHIGSRFCFFPANFMSSTYTDKNNLFHDVQRDIPSLEFSPSRVSIGFSQIAFSIIVLPKDDRTDSVQEERLGLPYWTIHFHLGIS